MYANPQAWKTYQSSADLTRLAQLQAHWHYRLRVNTSKYMGECVACQLLRPAQWRHRRLYLDNGGRLAIHDVHDSINVSFQSRHEPSKSDHSRGELASMMPTAGGKSS